MTSEKRIYLDTSAYLAILLNQKEEKKILKLIHNQILCSSSILLIEAERNIIRLSRENEITPKEFSLARNKLLEDTASFILRDVTPDLALTGEFPPILMPRSSDLIHLRTALWFYKNGGLAGFVSLDWKQKEAAKELGLNALE